jgi:RNA polymerase sigma factor (sigma-70 family)
MEDFDKCKLIADCANCVPGAQKELYVRYALQMLSLCLRYARNRKDAEDIFQQGFYLVYKNIAQVRECETLSGWIKTIFVNAALHWNQKNAPWDKILHERNEPVDVDLPNDALSAMAVAEITSLIQKLPNGCREVFNLFAIEGFPHLEIAALLGISVGTSKSQLHEARRILKSKILTQQ